MKIPRDLSGQNLIKMMQQKLAYQIVTQEESHVILQKDNPFKHRIAVPNHKSLRIGTLNSILRTLSSHTEFTKEQLLQLL